MARLVKSEDLEALAEDAYGRTDAAARFPDPLLLACGNDFELCPTLRDPSCRSSYRSRTLYYCPIGGDRRQQGEHVYHELAHHILSKFEIEHMHGDVYRFAIALMAPVVSILPILRGSKSPKHTGRLVVQANPYAPIDMLRFRAQYVWNQILRQCREKYTDSHI